MTENDKLDAIAVANDAKQGDAVLRAVHAFTARFVAYPSEHAHVAHTLWIAHAHLMKHWESTPRLAFLSAEPASGKTRALEVTQLLVPNPVLAVNVTANYLFRRVGGEDGVTVLFDEIDTVFSGKANENSESIRGILNAGHKRSGVSGRCTTDGKKVGTEEIAAYAPVALAGLHWLPDTIHSRAIIVRMRRRREGEVVEPFRWRHQQAEAAPIKSRLEVWTAAVDAIDLDASPLPDIVRDREADVWESLIAIADLAGGGWPELARDAAVTLIEEKADKEPTLGVKLLADLRDIFEGDKMATKAILEKLCKLEESPWRDMRGKPLDERGLAKRLRDYQVKSKTIRLADGSTAKGYERADLLDAWQRYLPAVEVTQITTPANVTVPESQYRKPPPRLCVQCGKGSEAGAVADAAIGGDTVLLHKHCEADFLAAEIRRSDQDTDTDSDFGPRRGAAR